DYSGHWQERGWDEEAPIHTMSKITTPYYQSEVPIGEPTLIGGVAFSGDRGISRVELTLDGGETWFDTTVEEPLSDTSWVLWHYQWTPEEETFAHVKARAYDADGTPQTEEPSDPLPDGSTGLHEIRVNAVQLEEPEDDESA
ncbi:MAG: molybdopterin-binding oxidoreductase, partial [Chloroflexota bacterium]